MKPKIGDYVLLKRPFVYRGGKMINIGVIEEVYGINKSCGVKEDWAQFLVRCDTVGTYLSELEFDVIPEKDVLAYLI